MFEKISGFFTDMMVKLLAKMPTTEFDADSEVASFREILGYLNYFVPIYKFKTDFFVWLGIMATATGIIAVYQIIKKKGLS